MPDMCEGAQNAPGAADGVPPAGRGPGAMPLFVPRQGQRGAPAPAPSPRRPGPAMPGEWPLQTSLPLGALPGAVPCARLHTRQVLWEWGRADLAEAAELVVSELMTNAVAATRPPGPARAVRPVWLWLASDGQRVLVLVADPSPAPPERIEAAGDIESGRGLLLVEAISSRWGWYHADGPGLAKVVWAELTGPEPG